MYAVIKTGQAYCVAAGDKIKVEQIAADEGKEITLDQVLAIGNGDNLTVGAPLVSGATVVAKVLSHGKHATRCVSSSCAAASITRNTRGTASRTPNWKLPPSTPERRKECRTWHRKKAAALRATGVIEPKMLASKHLAADSSALAPSSVPARHQIPRWQRGYRPRPYPVFAGGWPRVVRHARISEPPGGGCHACLISNVHFT